MVPFCVAFRLLTDFVYERKWINYFTGDVNIVADIGIFAMMWAESRGGLHRTREEG
jgi:hypothetical protein